MKLTKLRDELMIAFDFGYREAKGWGGDLSLTEEQYEEIVRARTKYAVSRSQILEPVDPEI